MPPTPRLLTPPWLASTSALVLLLAGAAGCASRHAAGATVAVSSGTLARATADDDLAVAAFRALLDDVIGDSADLICVSVVGQRGGSADGNGEDRDPSPAVVRALRSHAVTVRPYSACAADERNFGPTRGLLRLRDVTTAGDGAIVAHADAVGDHTARYECIVPPRRAAAARARCRMTGRD